MFDGYNSGNFSCTEISFFFEVYAAVECLKGLIFISSFQLCNSPYENVADAG